MILADGRVWRQTCERPSPQDASQPTINSTKEIGHHEVFCANIAVSCLATPGLCILQPMIEPAKEVTSLKIVLQNSDDIRNGQLDVASGVMTLIE